MLMEEKPTRVCGWHVHIIYTAYYTRLPYLRLGHVGHMRFHWWGAVNFSVHLILE